MGSESIDSSDFDSSESHSEAMRARGIIVLVNPTIVGKKYIPLLAS